MLLFLLDGLLLLRVADRQFLPLLFLRFERYLLAFKLQDQRAIFRPEWQPLCFGDGDISGIRPSSMSAAIVVGFKPKRFNRIPFLRARHSSVNRRELLSTGPTLAAGREFFVMMVSLPVPASRMISQNCCFASAMLPLIWKWSSTMAIISSKKYPFATYDSVRP